MLTPTIQLKCHQMLLMNHFIALSLVFLLKILLSNLFLSFDVRNTLIWMLCFCRFELNTIAMLLFVHMYGYVWMCLHLYVHLLYIFYPYSSMWQFRWAQVTWTYNYCDGFSFLHHPISNHLCLSPTQPSHVSHTQHKISGHFLPQRGMIHISYIACKSLGQNCFDETREVAGGRLALCLTLTVPRIQTSLSQKQ